MGFYLVFVPFYFIYRFLRVLARILRVPVFLVVAVAVFVPFILFVLSDHDGLHAADGRRAIASSHEAHRMVGTKR